MKFLANRKLAIRIGIITTVITFAGMLLLWRIVSDSAAAMVESNITNQMIDAVEARASIINDYVASAEEYMTAFALGSEVRELLEDPGIRSCCGGDRSIRRRLRRLRVRLRACILPHLLHMC